MQPLRAQYRPLQDSEPMLLVDDDEAKLFERHRSLHERVGSDDQVDRSGGDLSELLAAGRRCCRSGQQRDVTVLRQQR